MKRVFQSFSIIIFLLLFTSVSAQTFNTEQLSMPFHNPSAPMFGKDIIIYEEPTKDQENVALCSAFNGWMYCAFSYDSLDFGNILIMRSKDKGITWEPLYYCWAASIKNEILTRIDVITTGNTSDSLKVFVGFCYLNTISHSGGAGLFRLNGVTGVMEDPMMLYGNQDWITDLDLCSDADFPPGGVDPGTMAILYTREDSICIRTSSNGGLFLDGWETIAYYYPHHTGRLKLAYGISPLWNSGRYYAVWETRQFNSDSTGHIYYAHSEPNFNSPFTIPMCLDSLNPSTINSGSNPIIACQYGNSDNDSSNFTTIVLFETPYSTTGGGIQSYYNKQSTLNSEFTPFQFVNAQHDNKMSAASYNPYDSTFVITWLDNSSHVLPCVSNTVNLTNPNTWSVISEGYNDQLIVQNPYPQISINPAENSGAMAWIGNSIQDQRQVLFDAVYSTYTSSGNEGNTNKTNVVKAFPNPCDASTLIQFESTKHGYAVFSIRTIIDKVIHINNHIPCTPGMNDYFLNTSQIPSGNYIYEIHINNNILSGKLVVIH